MGGGGGISPTNRFKAVTSSSREATFEIKSATVVEVPAMRRSAASNSPEQVSLDLFSDSSVLTFWMICAIVVFVPLMRTSAAWNSPEHTSAFAASGSAGSWMRVTPASDGSWESLNSRVGAPFQTTAADVGGGDGDGGPSWPTISGDGEGGGGDGGGTGGGGWWVW